MGERALLIANPAAGKRHADDGDLAECVRLLTAAGFDIDRRETGTDGPSSADLAKAAIAEGFRVVLVAGGDGTVAPAAIALLETDVTLGILPFGSYMNIANGLGIPDAARLPARAIVYGALETHTHTIIDGVLSESPSFMPADVYLKTRLVHLPWLELGEERRDVTLVSEDHPERARRSRKR